jgi:hypothetical protein
MIAAVKQTTIRHLLPSDCLDEAVWSGLTDRVDPEWAWVEVDEEDAIQRVLLAAPLHGIVMLVRLWAAPGANKHGLRRFLHEAAAEWIADGYRGGMVLFQGDKSTELQLSRIAIKLSATPLAFTGYFYFGKLEVL